MTWIDTVVVGIIIVGAMVILYKGLKEPLDMLFRALGKVLGSIRDMVFGATESAHGEVITYG